MNAARGIRSAIALAGFGAIPLMIGLGVLANDSAAGSGPEATRLDAREDVDCQASVFVHAVRGSASSPEAAVGALFPGVETTRVDLANGGVVLQERVDGRRVSAFETRRDVMGGWSVPSIARLLPCDLILSRTNETRSDLIFRYRN